MRIIKNFRLSERTLDKKSGANVPVRVRRSVVQVDIERPRIEAVVAIAVTIRNIIYFIRSL